MKAMAGRCHGRMLRVVVVSVLSAFVLAPQAAAIDWSAEEKRYLRFYPKYMKIALPQVPYRNPLLRVMYLSGGIGMYYGGRETWSTCPLIRKDPQLAKKVAAAQIFHTPGDYQEARNAHVTKAMVVTAYHRGVLLGCSFRRR